MADFDFPRDPNSQFNFIDHKATGAAVIRLLAGLEEGFFHDDQHVRSLMRGDTDWPITPILKVGAACAFLKKLDPEHDYDAALVHQALADSLRVNHSIDPETMTSINRIPLETYRRSPY
jgi:hypothetical protein